MPTVELIQGNCAEKLCDIPDESIDLTVTSPPYDNTRTYNGNNALWGEHVWRAVIKELFRVTKQGGVVVWVVGDATIKGSETGTSFKQALWAIECGFNLHDTMIYKVKGTGAKGSIYSYWQEFEYMFVFSKGRPKSINFITVKRIKSSGGSRLRKDGTRKNEVRKNVGELIDSKIGNVWEYRVGGERKYKHPAKFPEQLAHDQIVSWSNPGDTVLDCFAGSGTTGTAAYDAGRNCILIELEEAYCETISRRFTDRFNLKPMYPSCQK